MLRTLIPILILQMSNLTRTVDFTQNMQCVSCVLPSYMAQQIDINERMRAILIDWLIEVGSHSQLNQCLNGNWD